MKKLIKNKSRLKSLIIKPHVYPNKFFCTGAKNAHWVKHNLFKKGTGKNLTIHIPKINIDLP